MPPKKEEKDERLGPWALGKFSNRLKVWLARPGSAVSAPPVR